MSVRFKPSSAKRFRPAPWDGIVIARVVKHAQRAYGQVLGVVRRIVQDTEAKVCDLLHQTQGGGVINTAYIERLIAILRQAQDRHFRARMAGLMRRWRSLLHQTATLLAGVYLVGTVYGTS